MNFCVHEQRRAQAAISPSEAVLHYLRKGAEKSKYTCAEIVCYLNTHKVEYLALSFETASVFYFIDLFTPQSLQTTAVSKKLILFEQMHITLV